jgi:ceramide glucosyltransferase
MNPTMSAVSTVLMVVVVTLAELALAYVVTCIAAAWGWHRTVAAGVAQLSSSRDAHPSVAVLKPLCGLEPDLEDNLRSFCDQTYPHFDVIMGAKDGADPALLVANRIAEDANGRVRVVVGTRSLGPNQKVNTLALLGDQVESDVIVISDSDIRVGPTYLEAVVEPLLDPSVGVVTCLYRGAPTKSLWSALGALAINEWFWPSVLVSRALGSDTYCSGATIAMRREVLEAIGGFGTFASLLADDHELGARIRQLGLRSIVSHYEVATSVDEPSLAALLRHELRWMRTIRTVQPLGHACSIVTYALPMTLLATLFANRHPWLLGLPVLAVVLRLALHWVVSRGAAPLGRAWSGRALDLSASAWLVPIRDLVSFYVWVASFANRRVVWRHQSLQVRSDGVLCGSKEAMPA